MYNEVQLKQSAMMPGIANAPESRSPIAIAMSELEASISSASNEYEMLSSQLSPVKNEPPQTDKASHGSVSAAPTCGMEAALREATYRINRLTDQIRSTRNGLCI